MTSRHCLKALALPWFVLLFLTLPSIGEAQKVKLAVWGDSRENLDRAASNIASLLLHDVTDWDVTVHT
ncbi:MAG: hypothetical protein IMZ55_15675, partial [Acidobacteria bacterium]|nr:hypothetical protein [Acidobacteriota bacterium]